MFWLKQNFIFQFLSMCLTRISIKGDLAGETAATSPTVWEALPDPLLLGACEVNSAVTASPMCIIVFMSFLSRIA